MRTKVYLSVFTKLAPRPIQSITRNVCVMSPWCTFFIGEGWRILVKEVLPEIAHIRNEENQVTCDR